MQILCISKRMELMIGYLDENFILNEFKTEKELS